MSKQVDYSKPVTGAERAWAEQFPGLHGQMLAASDEQHGVPPETLEGVDAGETYEDDYEKHTVADLIAEIKRRNQEEGTSLDPRGKQAELVARLREDDVARA